MISLQKANNRTILIVDDETDVLEFLQFDIELLSWQTVIADSTAKAFEALEKTPFFCILTDIAMPDMDGYEFIAEVRRREIQSEIILMTGFGYNPNHTLVKLNRFRQYPCLFKPFNRPKLADTIQSAYSTYHKDLEDK
jgi:DNA-binding NtrC family response regulator